MSCRGDTRRFDEDEWHRLLRDNRGKRLTVQVMARYNGRWTAYRRFHWFVANDSIDPYLTYRLIEPDYEVWNHLVLQQRCVENFSTRNFADHNLLENRCMNCHTPSQQDAATSMLYVRGKGGGAILNRNGMLRKLNIQASTADHSMVSPSVYFGFAPGGVSSPSRATSSSLPSMPRLTRLEVYDSSRTSTWRPQPNTNLLNTLRPTHGAQTSPPSRRRPTSTTVLLRVWTFPASCGSCATPCAIPSTHVRAHGTQVDTLVSSRSVCHPRISPTVATWCLPWPTMAPFLSGTARPTSGCSTSSPVASTHWQWSTHA